MDGDEYYANIDEMKQHPWYAIMMFIMLIALLATSICYSIYVLVLSRSKKRGSVSLVKCAVQGDENAIHCQGTTSYKDDLVHEDAHVNPL